MRVMCSNHSSTWYMGMCARYPDRTGWLLGPRHWKNPREGVAFALDNDAFTHFSNSTPFDFVGWRSFLARIRDYGETPLWAAVPDVVTNREATVRQWFDWAFLVQELGWDAALVVQDGMTMADVERCKPDVIFVGGSTEWKWSTAHKWCQDFPRVHVGRVRARRLPYCEQIGAESCDGTGWFRESVRGRPARQLEAWLENPEPHPELALR